MKKQILLYLSTLLLLVSCANVEVSNVIKNIDVAQAKELIKTVADLTILDVRTAPEVAQGKISGSKNLDYFGENFRTEVNKLDKTKPILVYCKSGSRSSAAAKILEESGFTIVYNLMGGYTSFKGD